MRDPPLFLFLFDCPDGGYEQYRMYCKYLYITFSSAARRPFILVWAMVIISLAETGAVQAQTEKTVQGQHDPTPYISHAEFQNISVGGELISSKSSGSQPTFRDILAVSSLDGVIRLFGEPKTFNRIPYPDGSTVRVDLNYGGLKMEYFKSAGKADFRLREMKITSSEWSLTVGEKELCPGMAGNQLSPPVRKSGYVYIAKQGTAKKAKRSGELEITDTRTQITFEIDEDSGTVKTIRFHQMI